jgi:hypothetical protein
VSLKKIIFEQYDGKVIYYSDYNDYFKQNMQVFTSHDFIGSVTQHIPGRGLQYIRRYAACGPACIHPAAVESGLISPM